ncbi:hypothetical protein [Actinotalea fermentans]|nr:hypothetical protein [Actinotalea fermentans]
MSNIPDIAEADVSYEEKGTWAYVVAGVAVFGGYVAWLLGAADGGPLVEVSYQRPLVTAIVVSVVATVVGRVLIEVVRPSESTRPDVRDKEVSRFGDYVGGTVLSILGAGVLALAIADADTFWIAQALYAAYVASMVASSVTKIVAYRRGL